MHIFEDLGSFLAVYCEPASILVVLEVMVEWQERLLLRHFVRLCSSSLFCLPIGDRSSCQWANIEVTSRAPCHSSALTAAFATHQTWWQPLSLPIIFGLGNDLGALRRCQLVIRELLLCPG
jgi:hypothetical protein